MESIKYSTFRVLSVLKRIPLARGVKNYKLIFLFVYILFQQTSVDAGGLLLHSNVYSSSELSMTIDEKGTPPLEIHGKISNETGEPISGVSVIIKSSGQGTASNAKGEFSLKANPGDKLQFTMIGYKTSSVIVENSNFISVILIADAITESEVVVVGYGTQKKINLTGAVSQVNGKVIANRSVSNIGQGLQGIIGNLNITTAGDPGGPGTPATYNIRGTTSLNGGGPLFIVDGVAVDDLQNINPTDVLTVTVLKDAASSAIYGARAAYGVIIITTKSGKKGQKMRLVYNDLFAKSTYTRIPKMANSIEYAIANNQAAVNSGLAPLFSDDLIAKIKQHMSDPNSSPVTIPNPTNPNRWDWNNALANNDWYAVYLKPWSFNQTHNLSLSGGSQNTTYYLSAGYYDEGGQLRYGNDQYKRYNVTNNIHSEVTKWMRADFRMKFNQGAINTPFPYADLTGNWFHLAGTRHPNWPVENPDGYLSQISALTFLTDAGRSITSQNNLSLTGAIELEPLKDWLINMDYTWNNQAAKISNHDAFIYAHAIDGSLYSVGHSQNSINQQTISNQYKSANIYSSYEKQLGKHYFKVLVGEQVEISNNFNLNGTRFDIVTDALPSMGVATGIQQVSSSTMDWATMGTFARINYNYDNKYLIELNGRNDGTSKFPKGRRFGFFPSVSAGYNISRESFWKPIEKYINYLKIRGSYGSLGNQDVANYQYLSLFNIKTNLAYILNNERPVYINAPGLVSPDLTWETARVFDLGVDANFLNNRLNLSYDWYIRNTLNMLGSSSVLPATLGAAIPVENNADLQTRGFELNLSWKENIGKNFGYNISFILSDYISQIKRLNSNQNKILTSNYQGKNLGEIWGYETEGLIQSDKEVQDMINLTSGQSPLQKQWSLGDVRYADLNGDGILDKGLGTLASHGDIKVIGNSTPRFQFGLNVGMNWKGFDFRMFWQGIGKRNLWLDQTNFWGWLGGYGSAVWKTTLDYWTPDNPGAYWPKPYASSQEAKNQQVQTRYLQNAAYIRLKNLQVGYNIPSQWLERISIESIRAFASAENLLTFSKINKNFDPEVAGGSWGSGKEYPLLKTISVGINISF